MEKKQKNIIVKKFYIIFGILLILLIPIGFLAGIVYNRESYRDKAVAEISRSWAARQEIETPKLTFPTGKKDEIKELELKDYNVDTEIHTELRKKGIFTVPVYTANVKMKGKFINNYGNLNNVKMSLTFKVSDAKGFIEQPTFSLMNENSKQHSSTNYTKEITTNAAEIPFEINFKLRGSNEIYIIPRGQNNIAKITGNWNNPSFEGNFLPIKRSVDKNNFQAEWSIPSVAVTSDSSNNIEENFINKPKLGVSLLQPVDNYRMAQRAVKYSFLFLVLTFLAYFIYEITEKEKVQIHQLQYLLMGIAMLIFYLLVVSISEFAPFIVAYLTATIMTITLISLYTYFVITKRKNPKFTLLITGIMAVLYTYLYVLLILQDLSLLLGSLGLFLIIAIVMYTTRNVEWYSENNEN